MAEYHIPEVQHIIMAKLIDEWHAHSTGMEVVVVPQKTNSGPAGVGTSVTSRLSNAPKCLSLARPLAPQRAPMCCEPGWLSRSLAGS